MSYSFFDSYHMIQTHSFVNLRYFSEAYANFEEFKK